MTQPGDSTAVRRIEARTPARELVEQLRKLIDDAVAKSLADGCGRRLLASQMIRRLDRER